MRQHALRYFINQIVLHELVVVTHLHKEKISVALYKV